MSGPKIGFAIDRYVAERRRRNEFSPATGVTIRQKLRDFVRMAELDRGQTMSEITKADINKYWAKEHGAPATVRNRLSSVRGFIQWGIENEWLKQDPTRHLKPPRSPRHVPQTFTNEEVAALLAVCPDARARLIVQLGVQLGLRRGEIAGLQRQDIDTKRALVFVKGKGGHERVLPLVDEVRSALRVYVAEYPGLTGPLIVQSQGGHRPLTVGTIGRMVAMLIKEAGLKDHALDGKSLHTLRRTAATDLLDGGAHVRQVQAVLGHTSLSSTERYLRRADAGELRPVLEGRRYGSTAPLPAIVVDDDGCVSFS